MAITETAVDYIREFSVKLWQYPAVKICTGAVLFLFKLLFGIYRPAYGAVTVLVLLDLALGLGLAALTTGVDSPKSQRGAVKMLVYCLLLVVGRQLSLVPVIGALISGLIDGLIILTEGISVLEKIDKWAHHFGRDFAILDPILALLKQKRERLIQDSTKKEG